MRNKQLIRSRSLNRILGNLHYCILSTYKKKYKCSSLNPDDDLPSTYPRAKSSLCMQFLSLQCHLHNAWCVILVSTTSQGLWAEHCSACRRVWARNGQEASSWHDFESLNPFSLSSPHTALSALIQSNPSIGKTRKQAIN